MTSYLRINYFHFNCIMTVENYNLVEILCFIISHNVVFFFFFFIFIKTFCQWMVILLGQSPFLWPSHTNTYAITKSTNNTTKLVSPRIMLEVEHLIYSFIIYFLKHQCNEIRNIVLFHFFFFSTLFINKLFHTIKNEINI